MRAMWWVLKSRKSIQRLESQGKEQTMRVPTANITPEAGPLVCGPCKLNERMGSMTGVIHKVYNNGWAALFQADTGPALTILPRDLDSEQPPLTVKEVLRELARIFRQPLANNL